MSGDTPITLGDAGRVELAGEWTIGRIPQLLQAIERARRSATPVTRVDASGIHKLDTAGASILLEWIGGVEKLSLIDGFSSGQARLMEAVANAGLLSPSAPERRGIKEALASIGASMASLFDNSKRLIAFLGLLLAMLPGVLFNPRRWRVAPCVNQIQQTGLNAVPIIVLLTFLVGAVVAFLGATILKDFGATLYTVDLIAFSFLREFGVLLTAIMVAGRSGSAFTAQLGSMKSREEIDAIRTLGMDPMDVLVVPRVLALLISLPLLTILAMLSGIVGGALVCAMSLDISPVMYFSRINDVLDIRHFWVGLSKAPIFAVMIALIGCLEGFKVAGSAESVGRHTTSSVVQAIFVVILIDALAAVFFMEMGW